MTSIEWTDRTWNPIVGCSRVSPGCEHCYAERFVHRELAPQHRGLTVLGKGEKGPRWTGEVRLVESALAKPFSWRKPARVFVNSLSDLWHPRVPNETVAAIFGVMAACPHLTFQVLTKRPERMRAWFEWAHRFGELRSDALRRCRQQAMWRGVDLNLLPADVHANGVDWPLPNVWLGVTAEDQQRADERIPVLLDTPAALRFVSYEPALGPVSFRDEWIGRGRCATHDTEGGFCSSDCPHLVRGLDWVIVGGESGPGARPFDIAWARSVIEQCRETGVPVFVKQLGANVRTRNDDNFTIDDNDDPCAWPTHLVEEDRIEHDPDGRREEYQGAPVRVRLRHRKGADPSEWPEDLRVRELPA